METAIWIIILLAIVLIVALFKGVVKTFKRNEVVAILCIIFLFPFYLIWAFIEIFTGEID